MLKVAVAQKNMAMSPLVLVVAVLVVLGSALGARLPLPKVGRPHGRIAGGQDAQKGQFPYQVSMKWVQNFVVFHSCGASVLNENWVLTAGHCITEMPTDGYHVPVAGDYDLGVEEGTEQPRNVAEIIVHPDFQGGVTRADIALVRVASPFFLNEFVQPVALPAAGSIPTGLATLTGWGSISFNETFVMPDILQTAQMDIVPYEECLAAWGDGTTLDRTMVCTGPLEPGLSACGGDSGGPLVLPNSEGVLEQIGVVSWGGYPCGTANHPSVHTRVSAFIDFINQYVQ